MVIGRFFLDKNKRSHTYYGLTPKRVLIVSEGKTKEVKSINLKTLSDITYREGKNASGTIYLGPTDPRAEMFSGTAWPGISSRISPRIEQIKNVRNGYDQISRAQQELS